MAEAAVGTHSLGRLPCYDLIMPLFMFIVGAAMPFSFGKHLASGTPHRVIYRRMASRFALLWVFGYVQSV